MAKKTSKEEKVVKKKASGEKKPEKKITKEIEGTKILDKAYKKAISKAVEKNAEKKKEIKKLSPQDKLWAFIENNYLGMDSFSIQESFARNMEYTQAKTRYTATDFDCYKSLACSVKDRIMERWNDTQRTYYEKNAKRVFYLSLEFLIGRALGNNLINLGMEEECHKALMNLGYKLEDLAGMEPDAGLGNGGLGRLAACFLDSMATLQLPGSGYGIRYEYGIFEQRIENGYQIEKPDNWLRYGNPWEIVRPEYRYDVEFYGYVDEKKRWKNTKKVIALAYDMPVVGYKNDTVNTLRLWSAKAEDEFALECFNRGDYICAVEDKIQTENISKVLYPKDDIAPNRELRLKQEYFFASATLQDIIRRYKITNDNFDNFPEKIAIQLNDTHPAIAIPELMRILVDIQGLSWEKAWHICINTFAYTNHTILPEALEKWPVDLLGRVLPRHLQIIYEINHRFLEEIKKKFPGDEGLIERISIIEERPIKSIRMAYLSIVGSHSINGVAELHTEIIKEKLFSDFYRIWPEKFNCKTNGITQRRWLKLCNPDLSDLISEHIGEKWPTDLYELKKLENLAKDKKFRDRWKEIKKENKRKLAEYIKEHNGISVNINSIFDTQIKRLHEYKRQLMNVLHIITLYSRIKENPGRHFVPRTFIFGAKAAPGYYMAKLIIKLINSVAEVVNNDPQIGDKIKVIFLENYSVSLAEKIIPATDLSEQISTAGMEASGTGNMKFALNGALTIGTLDGANVEIKEEVGDENIFIFGLKADEVEKLKNDNYNPWNFYNGNPELKKALNMLAEDYFNPDERGIFKPIIESLLPGGDNFLVLADYASYVECQEKVSNAYENQDDWTKKSIINTANTGKFSSDRTIKEYAEKIWKVKPVKPEGKHGRTIMTSERGVVEI